MNEILFSLSAVCLILPAQISQYDQIVNGGYCMAYSSPAYKIIVTAAKYLSILPVFMCIYEMGYGEISWFLKMIIWAVFYVIVKIFGTWLFNVIFGFGRGGAMTSLVVFVVGIVMLIIALII